MHFKIINELFTAIATGRDEAIGPFGEKPPAPPVGSLLEAHDVLFDAERALDLEPNENVSSRRKSAPSFSFSKLERPEVKQSGKPYHRSHRSNLTV